jgi:hypothetical protein
MISKTPEFVVIRSSLKQINVADKLIVFPIDSLRTLTIGGYKCRKLEVFNVFGPFVISGRRW